MVPSRIEGFGLPVVEALAAGGVVIRADARGLREAGGGAAPCVDVDDPVGLAQWLRLLMDPPSQSWLQPHLLRRWGQRQRLEGALEVIRKPGGTHLSYQEHSYLARSRYDEQLPRYFELFGRNRVLVLRSDDLFSGDRRALERIQQFLNIRPFLDDAPIPAENKGAGEATQVPEEVRQRLKAQLEPTCAWLDQTLDIRW